MNRIAESVLIYYKNSEINRIIIITIIIYDLCFVIFRNGFRFGFSVFVVILRHVASLQILGGHSECERSEQYECSVRSTRSELNTAGGLGGAVSPPTGSGAEPRKIFELYPIKWPKIVFLKIKNVIVILILVPISSLQS